MAKEYILTNPHGDKIHLTVLTNKAEAVLISLHGQENLGPINNSEEKISKVAEINSNKEIKLLHELIKAYFNNESTQATYRNTHNLNKTLLDLLGPIELKSSEKMKDFRFIQREYKKSHNEKVCYYYINKLEETERLHEPEKDKTELLKPASINRFQFFADSSSFVGRTAEITYLREMCENTENPFLWSFICGEGGSGKSRLALELCERLSGKGWNVYAPCHAGIKAEQIKSDLGKIDTNILICFDDVNSDIENVLKFMNYCIETTFRKNQKIRLLLIDREFVDYPLMASNVSLYRYQGNKTDDLEVETESGCLKVNHPSTEETFIIMRSFLKKIYKIDLTRSTFDNILYPGLQQIDKDNERPLFALLIADGWASLETKFKGKVIGYTYPSDVFETLYLNECHRLRELIEKEYKLSKQEKALEAMKCCITLSSFLDESSAYKHIEVIREVTHFEIEDSFYWVMEQAGYMKNGTLFKPFPDIVEEYFSLKYINSISNKDHLITLIGYLLKEGKTRTLDFAKQICNDYSDILFPPSNMSIFQHLTELNKIIRKEQSDLLFKLSVQQAPLSPNINDPVLECLKHEMENRFLNNIEFGNIKFPIEHGGFHLGMYGTRCDSALEKDLSKYPYNVSLYFHNMCTELIISFFEQNKDKIFIRSDDPIVKDKIIIHCEDPTLYNALSSSSYEGQILFDMRWGEGTFEDSNGNIYKGQWNMNIANGKGEMSYSDGSKYIGSWEDGRKCGYGIMTYFDKTKYEGEWFYGVPYGHGTMTWPDKSVSIECEWESGRPSGIVEMTLLYKNIVLSGEWEWDKATIKNIWKPKGGKLQGDEIVWPDGTRYLGARKGTVPDGIGKLWLFDGRIYEGRFKNGLPNGDGKMTWPKWLLQSRKEYEGTWKDGKCHGKGKMIYADGRIYSGEWEHDIKFGTGKLIYSDETEVTVYSDEEGTRTEDGRIITEDSSIIDLSV